jgi:hypothetical protein
MNTIDTKSPTCSGTLLNEIEALILSNFKLISIKLHSNPVRSALTVLIFYISCMT